MSLAKFYCIFFTYSVSRNILAYTSRQATIWHSPIIIWQLKWMSGYSLPDMESRSTLSESGLSTLASWTRLWTSKLRGRSTPSPVDTSPPPSLPADRSRLPSASPPATPPPPLPLLLLYSLPWRPAAATDVRRRPTSPCFLHKRCFLR